jgi:hypothetical protein
MSDKCSVVINGIEYTRKQSVTKDYVIVRTYSAGVFAGNLVGRAGKEVVLKNARRIWYWDGAASLSQLAVDGTSKPEKCKFPCEVPEIVLTEAIEIIPCTEKAEKSIKAVPVWQK